MDEVAIVVVGWGIFCTETAQILEFDMNSFDSVDEGIDCLVNYRSYQSGGNGENKVDGVVIFGEGIVFINIIATGVNSMSKYW